MAERRDGVQVLSRAGAAAARALDGSRGPHADRARRPGGAAALDLLPHRRGALSGGAHAAHALRQAAHRGRPHRHRRGRPPRAAARSGAVPQATLARAARDGRARGARRQRGAVHRSVRAAALPARRGRGRRPVPALLHGVRQGAPRGAAARQAERLIRTGSSRSPSATPGSTARRCSRSSTSSASPASPSTTRSTRSASRRWARRCTTPAARWPLSPSPCRPRASRTWRSASRRTPARPPRHRERDQGQVRRAPAPTVRVY